MFPLTHIAVAGTVLKRETRDTVLGSMLPDFVSYLGVGRNVGHEMGFDLYHYACEYHREFLDLALGVLTHGTCLPGLDFYADESYHGDTMGFCFQQGYKIADQGQRICRIPPSMALWKSHNIIELAFDAITAQRFPELGHCGESALEKVDDRLCGFLSGYFRVPENRVAEMFREVPKQFSFDGSDHALMMKKFLRSLERRHGIVGGDLRESIALMEEAIEIVLPQYDEFMGEVLPLLERSLAPYLR